LYLSKNSEISLGMSSDVSVDKCPVCTEEMVRSVYVGEHPLIKDVGHPDYKPFVACPEFDENGEPNFIDYDR
jgi:hypothetical protein